MNTHSPVDELSLLERTFKTILDGTGKVIPGIPSLGCTEPDYPSTAVLLDVPGFCQVSTYTCGITSSWSIITALGYRVTLKDWFKRCHKAGCNPDEGMSIDQIGKALKSLRLKVVTKRYRGRNQVAKLVDAGQPLLFGQGAEMFDHGDHWMYLYGYSARNVYVGNVVNPAYPIRSKEAWTWRRFENKELNPKELYLINT
jgi:hypothetical protein